MRSRRSLPLSASRLPAMLKWATAPGNVISGGAFGIAQRLSGKRFGDLVPDRVVFTRRVARLPETLLELILAGIDVVLGR